MEELSTHVFLYKAAQQLMLCKTNLFASLAGRSHSDTVTANQFRQIILHVEQGTVKFNEDMEAWQHHFLFRGYFKDKEKKAAKQK